MEGCLITTLTKKMAEDLNQFLIENRVRSTYLHSEVDAMNRLRILQRLNDGEVDVVVGVNLLREGLDLPRVSLVAIMDADKEGFLRSGTALIQTIGRAARNISGEVLMFADRTTEAMRFAISETDRRRAKQSEFNARTGFTPVPVSPKKFGSGSSGTILEEAKAARRRLGRSPTSQGTTLTDLSMEKSGDWEAQSSEDLRKAMVAAAASMDFELATRIRDFLRARETSNS